MAIATVVLAVGLGGCAKGQGSTKAFCDNLRRLSNRSVLLGRFDPSNPADLRVYRRQAATDMSQLERAAPREIKPDVAAVADLTAEIAQLAEKYQDNPGELQYRLYNLGRRRVGAAGSVVKVRSFAKDKCGIDLNPRRTDFGGRTGSGSDTGGGFDTSGSGGQFGPTSTAVSPGG